MAFIGAPVISASNSGAAAGNSAHSIWWGMFRGAPEASGRERRLPFWLPMRSAGRRTLHAGRWHRRPARQNIA
jgi:hypothetical protein